MVEATPTASIHDHFVRVGDPRVSVRARKPGACDQRIQCITVCRACDQVYSGLAHHHCTDRGAFRPDHHARSRTSYSASRIGHLATGRFAEGNYTQRVPVSRADEVGQLEQQFNRMAEQLVASIAQQQALAEQNARIQERARISRDLHDAISQNLFSLRTLTDGLQSAIQGGARVAELQPHIELLEQTTNTMTREMRALLLEMRPPQLEGLELSEALAALADAYTSRLGIAVTTSIAPVILNATTEQALLRIAQEALSNAARHANATLITLSLAVCEQAITLTITDNGQGMSRDESDKSYGLGLRLMQERVQELQGSFLLDSNPGQGTRIEIRVPEEVADDTRPHR